MSASGLIFPGYILVGVNSHSGMTFSQLVAALGDSPKDTPMTLHFVNPVAVSDDVAIVVEQKDTRTCVCFGTVARCREVDEVGSVAV